jgi:hypothetical protein
MIAYRNSSAIERLTYDEQARTLEIVFAVHRGGGTKTYADVPADLAAAFAAAESKGKFYNLFIRARSSNNGQRPWETE